MNKITSILLAGTVILITSLALLYGFISFYPALMEEYYNPVFRSNSFETDWLFYLHPFVLSGALFLFWEISKQYFEGSPGARAIKGSFTYGLIAMAPVLLLTFSAINVSALMVFTWIAYGIVQTFVALLVFAYRNS